MDIFGLLMGCSGSFVFIVGHFRVDDLTSRNLLISST